MATLDRWHGYATLCNITMYEHGRVYLEADGAKIIRRGIPGQMGGHLDYELSPFSGTTLANEVGDGWYRTVEPVERDQAPYLPFDLAEYLFEILVNNRITPVGEWSNFFYCFGQKRFGSRFLRLKDRFGGVGPVKFLNPSWQIESLLDEIRKDSQRRIQQTNSLLLKVKQKWQSVPGWDSHNPEHFGIRSI